MRKLYFVALVLAVAMGFLATSCTGTRVVKRYPWEEARKSLATTTDAILCYGGSHHRTPYLWDQARLAPLVTYTDPAGREHWLFDGFIFLEFQDTNRCPVLKKVYNKE